MRNSCYWLGVHFLVSLFAWACLRSVVVSAEEQPPVGKQACCVLEVPEKSLCLPVRAALPAGCSVPEGVHCTVVSQAPDLKVSAEVLGGPDANGELRAPGYLVLRSTSAEKVSQDKVQPISLQIHVNEGSGKSTDTFRWDETSEVTLTLRDDHGNPVLAYNFGPITNPSVPANDPRRTRACYIHPVWGLKGEVLTDDFPRDHYHHHGIFWTWPHVVIRDQEYSLWEDKGALRQRFRKWLCREAGEHAAVLGVENGWMIDEECLLAERVWITVYKADSLGRMIDIDLFLLPHVPVTLWGAEGKSYGGLTMRFRPPSQKDAMITVPAGLTGTDLYETRLPWADFTSLFGDDGASLSGGTIMVAPDHPDYPPTWLTRHYGPLCIGWPGIQSRTLEPGSCTRLSYRIWIHSDLRTAAEIHKIYEMFCAAAKLVCQKSDSQ